VEDATCEQEGNGIRVVKLEVIPKNKTECKHE
jgi:hypothetical protein